jgi:hypothetical protein
LNAKVTMAQQPELARRSEPSIAGAWRRIGAAAGVACGLAGCAPSVPPRPVVAQVPPQLHVAASPPDWFHRELARARHARVAHVPHGDQVGAQRAYYQVMVPACRRVARSGPDKYRARCAALVQHEATASAADAAAIMPAPDDFSCNDERDDSRDDPARVTACSD